MALCFQNVAFQYELASAPLFFQVDVDFPPGWSGVIGGNGTGKSTLLYLAAGLLAPTEGRVLRPSRVALCEQRTDDPPPDCAAFLQAHDREAIRLRRSLAVESAYLSRWHTLSHGERKRLQIAVALWHAPDVLLLDEPTNHVDGEVRSLLRHALSQFRGVGLLVSHDRDLLDDLCGQCLFLEPPRVRLFPGGYSAAAALRAQEESTRAEDYRQQRNEVRRIEAEQARRRAEASASHQRRSKRHLDKHDSDGRARINLIRVSGADGQAGRQTRQLEGRLRQGEEALRELRPEKRYDLNFWLPESRSTRNRLVSIPGGGIPMGRTKRLIFPDLEIGAGDRVALTGPNGGGKSTLLRYLLERVNLPAEKVLYLPQEIDRRETEGVAARVAGLPPQMKGLLMTVVSCLGSRPERLLRHGDLSPGEVRKLLLAFGVTRAPHLIVMDEPTNHLDLPAVELLEGALASCPCALLLVSHDERFLGRLATVRWRIEPGEGGISLLTVGAASAPPPW